MPDGFVTENWNLSQFWYTEATRQILAKEIYYATLDDNIAFLSCPSLYHSFTEMYYDRRDRSYLFEFDSRFYDHAGENFLKFDCFNVEAMKASVAKRKFPSFDYVVADPPYLSIECLESMSNCVKFLAGDKGKILYIAGDTVVENVPYYLPMCHPLKFLPQNNTLRNAFFCYVNYDSAYID